MKKLIISFFLLTLCYAPSSFALTFNFFSNVDFAYSKGGSSDPGFRKGTFGLGQMDFFLTHAFNDHFHFLGEFVVEFDTVANAFAIDAERMQVGFSANDYFGVDVGRFHTPFGYWSTAYHHGAVLYLPAQRPFFLRFEDDGGILPVHSIGLMLGGHTVGEKVSLHYMGYVANGPRITGGALDPVNVQDLNRNKIGGADLQTHFHGGALEGLQFGVGGLFHRVQTRTGAVLVNEVEQSIISFDTVYEHNPWHLMGEYFYLRNKDKLNGNPTNHGHAFYGQAGYTFLERWTPYARWEQLDIGNGDTYFSDLSAGDRSIFLAGLNIKLPMQNVLKFEGRGINLARSSNFPKGSEWVAQWAFGF